MRKIDLTGETFGRLLVIEEAVNKTPGGNFRWVCRCTCGKIVTYASGDLRKGNIKSCGCYAQELKTTHGQSKTLPYSRWLNMKERCYNENNAKYADYGGRGILICEEWRDNFESFYEDMGDPPSSEYTIDRIDNDLGYCKQNCQWATKTQQVRNQRKRKDSSSAYRGVQHSRGKWYAAGTDMTGRRHHLGTFKTEIDAAIAYDKFFDEYGLIGHKNFYEGEENGI